MRKVFLPLLCILFLLTGCGNSKLIESSTPTKTNFNEEETEEITYSSKISSEECALCNKAGNTLLPIYAGQKNLGIICINTFDMSPISINRYDDFGNLLEESAGSMSTTVNSFGEGEMSTHVTPDSDRGYANVDVSFTKDKDIDQNAIESLLCQNCLTAIMDKAWGNPYAVGVIDFDTLEIKLFEESCTAFTFGDYYINIDKHENKSDPECMDLDLLIFYCPPRYE